MVHSTYWVCGGCEALVHTVQELLASEEDDLHIMQVDFVNAFNLADRSRAFNEVKDHFPELAQWVASCYGVAAHLMYGDVVISSTCGFLLPGPSASSPTCRGAGANTPNQWLNPRRWPTGWH